jgi:hypothetical protein
MEDAPARVARWLEETGAPVERQGERGWSVAVPCSKRGEIGVALMLRERTLELRAFVMRAPDRNHREVWERLLRKNLSTRDWRFGTDAPGDVWLAADAPLEALDGPSLDGLLGALSAVVDETYEGIVRTGFDVPEGTEFRPPPPPPPPEDGA